MPLTDNSAWQPPILRHKRYDQPSTFAPENLLREARRQKGLEEKQVSAVCVLDPDGDIVRHLVAAGKAQRNPYWACYHTDMYDVMDEGVEFGIVGRAVGASFAVLVAEEMFAAGCSLLISVTSAGQIQALDEPPYFLLIEQALRDEGTSYHYLPPSEYVGIDDDLRARVSNAFSNIPVPVYSGTVWTTDAPFRETALAVEKAKAAGIHAVEMEAAALYAFAQARKKPVVCFAHVTNQMAQVEGDFEKGTDAGSRDALQLIRAMATDLRSMV